MSASTPEQAVRDSTHKFLYRETGKLSHAIPACHRYAPRLAPSEPNTSTPACVQYCQAALLSSFCLRAVHSSAADLSCSLSTSIRHALNNACVTAACPCYSAFLVPPFAGNPNASNMAVRPVTRLSWCRRLSAAPRSPWRLLPHHSHWHPGCCWLLCRCWRGRGQRRRREPCCRGPCRRRAGTWTTAGRRSCSTRAVTPGSLRRG